MSTADHVTCCCADTLDDLRALQAAYESAGRDRVNLTHRLNTAIAERDRARDTAARLEAELARGFRTAAPDITLSRTNNGAPATPEAVPREGQEGAGSAPSRAADGLAGSDRHSGTPATAEAHKSAESDAGLSADSAPDPAPIIEWLASVGLDAKGIPADGVRIIGRTPLGGCLLLVQSFEVTPDGRRIILADGSGFARTRHRRIEVTTLPPEPWLSTWGGWRGSPPTPCPCLDAPTPQDRPQESP